MLTRLATIAAVLATALAGVLTPTVALATSDGGNNGTVKIAEDGDIDTPSNDPHVGCTFTVEWYGFDQGSDIVSHVSFEMQAPTSDVALMVTGDTSVFVGADDASGGGSAAGLDGRQQYTLGFTGTPHPVQGYHLKMTVDTPGSNGADRKSKVFWVTGCGDAVTPDPTDDPTGDPTDDPAPDPEPPFSWDWTYPDPTCTALTVDYPANLPDGQANDVNVRVLTDQGEVTLNFHDNDGFWSGHTVFDLTSHPSWPAGVTTYSVVWTQVGGTNYHWQGNVRCLIDDDGDPATDDSVLEVTRISGFRTGTVTVDRGDAVTSDLVTVRQSGDEDLVLQRLSGSTWTDVRTIAVNDDDARVAFGRQTRRGTFHYRLAVDGSDAVTGATTRQFTVRVR